MKINEITESFDTQVPRKVVSADADGVTIEAEIGDRKIVFDATVFDEEGGRRADIAFYEKHGKTEFYTATGSGNEMQVFAFIFDSLRDVIIDFDPDVVSFESRKSEGNRTSLYKKMVSRFPNYKIADIGSEHGMDVFTIVKKDK